MLAAAGRTVESLPGDMQTAFRAGNLAPSAITRYLQLDSNWLTKIFMPLQGAPCRVQPACNVCHGCACTS